MGRVVYLNGRFVDKKDARISVFDHGLLYGDGVFEGIRSYNRLVFRLKEHINRLYQSAGAIELEIPVSKGEMVKAVVDTLRKNRLNDAYIRLVVTRGYGDLGLDPRKCRGHASVFIITDKIMLYPKKFYENGLHIIAAKTKKNYKEAIHPNIKSLNYLNNILAKIDAIKKNAPEAIMLTYNNYVSECTGDNIFIIKGRTLVTPPREIALRGITQEAVIDMAGKMRVSFREKNVRIGDICCAKECFLTGTAAEIIPVTRVDKCVVGNGRPGPITLRLMAGFKEMTKTDGIKY